MKHEIQGIKLTDEHLGLKVTYIPNHANGDINHEDSEVGKIMHWNDRGVMVDYFRNKCRTYFNDLVWG